MNRSHRGLGGAIAGVMMLLLLSTPEVGAVGPALPIDPVSLGQTGTSTCGGPSQAECGFAKATKQGAWSSDQSCPSGSFHDPLTYGGSCWSCPEHFVRSLKPVTDPAACWRPAHPEYAAATRITHGTIFPHECWSQGAFWDGYDGGGCWTCPEDHPARGSAHIATNEACWVDSGHQERPANLEEVKGCASKTPGQLYPDGRPFHDPIDGGTCWTCPQFSERTVFAVTSDQACDVGFSWTTPEYPEPGLFGLDGAVDVITTVLQHPQDMTDFLYVLAKAGHVPAENRPAWVAARWAEIAATPEKSDALNSLANLKVIEAAAKFDTLPADAPSKRLANAFAQYVRDRRTFVAQDALHMYDGWKAGVDYQRSQHPPNVGNLFYIGTPPPDFLRQAQENWFQLAGGAAAGLGVVGAAASAAAFSATIPEAIWSVATADASAAGGLSTVFTQAFNAITTGAEIAEGVFAAAGAAMAGPAIIAAVGTVIAIAAIDIVVKSETARPTLVANLDAAKEAVDIKTFVNDSEAFGYFWALGTPGGSAFCPSTPGPVSLGCGGYAGAVQTVRTAAGTGLQGAQLTGFAASFAQPPQITSAAATAFARNAAGAFTVTTSGTTPKITLTGTLPGGVTFADNGNGTAKISGTPGESSQGVYLVTLKVQNDVGAATQSFRLTIGTPPSFTSVPVLSFTEGLSSTFTIRTAGDPTPTLNLYDTSPLVICGASGCSSPLAGRGNLPSGVTFQANADGTATISGTPAPGTGNGSASASVLFGGRLAASNLAGTVTQDVTVTVQRPPLTALSPAKVWIGLRNSDDIGLRVDLLAEVLLKVGASETLIGQGRLDNQSAGGSGFNNAALNTIPLTLTGAPVLVPDGAQLEFRLSARRTCSGGGHAAGTVLLWYDGRAIDSGNARDAGSRLGAARGSRTPTNFALRSGLALSETAGTAKTSVAVSLSSMESCTAGRSYVPVGTWTSSLP